MFLIKIHFYRQPILILVYEQFTDSGQVDGLLLLQVDGLLLLQVDGLLQFTGSGQVDGLLMAPSITDCYVRVKAQEPRLLAK